MGSAWRWRIDRIRIRRVLLVANPRSRSGSDAAAEAADLLATRDVEVETIRPDSRDELVARLDASPAPDCVAIAGGDGTLHYHAPALAGRELPVAVIPGGTANDFARSLGLDGTVADACRALTAGHVHPVDLGMIDDEPFLNAAHVGLGAAVASAMSDSGKQQIGVFEYLRQALRRAATPKRFRARVTVDGERHEFRSIQLSVGNARYYGGGNVLDAGSTIDDGHLYLYSVRPRSLAQLLRIAPLLRRGRGGREIGIDRRRGQRIELETDRAMPVFADGEQVGRTPLALSVRRGAIRFILAHEEEPVEDDLILPPARAALRDVATAVRRAARYYADMGAEAGNGALGERLGELRRQREAAAERLEARLADFDLLPQDIDPDRETLGRLADWIHERLAEDEEQALLADCARRDRDILASIDEAMGEGLAEEDADHLRQLREQVATDVAELERGD